jgi:hypothetical protein
MRPGEVEGIDYYFVSKAQFESWIAADQLLEHALVYGEYKGIPRRQVDAALQRGCDVVLRIDVQVCCVRVCVCVLRAATGLGAPKGHSASGLCRALPSSSQRVPPSLATGCCHGAPVAAWRGQRVPGG